VRSRRIDRRSRWAASAGASVGALALALLATHGEDARLLAGGQSLLILRRQRLVALAPNDEQREEKGGDEHGGKPDDGGPAEERRAHEGEDDRPSHGGQAKVHAGRVNARTISTFPRWRTEESLDEAGAGGILMEDPWLP